MKRSIIKSPYLWTVVFAAAVVAFAWVGRANYQPVITGAVAPDFTAVTLEGEPVSLSDYQGRVVLVNIWATWCAPCREEMPSMQRLYEALDGTDFEILAVSVDSRPGEINLTGQAGGNVGEFASGMGLTFPILHDADAEIQQVYQTTGVPESFVVGRDGIIYKKLAGPTNWDAAVHQELIRRLLGS